MPWNLETAEAILKEFQAKFEAEIAKGVVVTDTPRGYSPGSSASTRGYTPESAETARSYTPSSGDSARKFSAEPPRGYPAESADAARSYLGGENGGKRGRYLFHSYSSLGLRQLITTFSQPSTTTIIVGYVLMVRN